MEFVITRFFFLWQVFLLLASILVSSTILNDVPTDSVDIKYKYYSNKKGTQVVEIGPGSACEIFQGEDAAWLVENKRDVMTVLNYIQFRLLVGKCQLDAIFKPLIHSQELPNNHITTSESHTTGGKNASLPGIEVQLNTNKRNGSEVVLVEATSEKELTSSTSTSSPATSSETSSPSPTSTMPLIFPGTKWCGAGSSARYHDDLGLYVHTDKCCREHDFCPENMAGKKCKYGLCNDSDFTRSSCDCDYEFRMCLQKDRSLSSLASFKIANLYFNILKPLCYARRPPVKSCRRHRITGECVDFEFDSDFDQEWQFFPAQPYLSEAVEKLIQPVLPSLQMLPQSPFTQDRVHLLSPNLESQGSSTPSSQPQTSTDEDEIDDDEDQTNEDEND